MKTIPLRVGIVGPDSKYAKSSNHWIGWIHTSESSGKSIEEITGKFKTLKELKIKGKSKHDL